MYNVKEKRKCDDESVVMDDDVWVGTNITLLKGVIVGRRAIIAAGSVVKKMPPPYSNTAGVPGRVVKFRWEVAQILDHEKKLYPQEKRYGFNDLVEIQKMH